MFILDLVIILFLALMTFIGYKKGLISIAFSIISFFIAIALAFLLYKPISNVIINNTNIDESIQNTVFEKLSSKDTTELENSFSYMIEDVKSQAVDSLAVGISQKVSILVINLLAWIIILLLTKIILFFFKTILNTIAKLPILKQINKSGGLVFGFLKGLFLIYLVLGILLITENILVIENFNNLLNKSLLTKFLYSNNILIFLLKR